MYFEKLSNSDKQKIEYYINAYARDYSRKERASLEKILSHWDCAKSSYLSTLFGDNLIVSKEVEFEEGTSEIMDKLEDVMYRDQRCHNFIESVKSIYNRSAEYGTPEEKSYWFLYELFGFPTLANNKIEKAFNDLLIRDKIVKVQAGTKPMRIISKIATAYGIGTTPDADGISDLEYFRRKHSQCLNNKLLKGNLCLSIHPLDYMTMSDNDCGWSSCMSWQEGGEYRQGTVEMMNSPCVVVGYLTSEDNMQLAWRQDMEDPTWNSKKWRCLFIVDKNFIINVKQYPYYNDNLVKAAIAQLAEMSGWENAAEAQIFEYYENYDKHRRSHTPCEINGRNIAIDFTTGAMYNDFGSAHYITLNPEDTGDFIDHNYCFSGLSECMNCGEAWNYWDNDTTCLICCQCDSSHRCEWCGNRAEEDVYTTEDGYSVCEYCWNEYTEKNIIDERFYMRDNLKFVRIARTNEELTDSYAYDHSFFVHPDDIGRQSWCELFKIAKPRQIENRWGETVYYVLPKDCNEEVFEILEYDFYHEDMEKYIELSKQD